MGSSLVRQICGALKDSHVRLGRMGAGKRCESETEMPGLKMPAAVTDTD